MNTTLELEKETDFLQDKLVEIKVITRATDMFSDKQAGSSMFPGAKVTISLPRSESTRQLIPILSEEGQKFFEKKLHRKDGDLNFYDPNSPFWSTFTFKLSGEDNLKLNLADPVDNLRYRILKVMKNVAPSWDARFDRGEYKFAILEDGYDTIETNKKSDKLERAYEAFGEIKNSIDKLTDVLEVYGKKVPKDAKLDWLQAQVRKMITNEATPKTSTVQTIDEFLLIVEDKHFETKVLIEKAVQAGALIKSGKTGYKLPGQAPEEVNTANHINEMVEFLQNKKNQEILLKIKAQVSAHIK